MERQTQNIVTQRNILQQRILQVPPKEIACLTNVGLSGNSFFARSEFWYNLAVSSWPQITLTNWLLHRQIPLFTEIPYSLTKLYTTSWSRLVLALYRKQQPHQGLIFIENCFNCPLRCIFSFTVSRRILCGLEKSRHLAIVFDVH